MLRTLRVKNLAIVENIRVEFNEGLNVITGETGAGKSIITGALGLLLGERADKTLIRAGEDTCGVEALFELADAATVDALLEELGLPPCENGRLIIRRMVSASGAGKNLINDSSATVQALARLGNLLVDMHGPHDHQSLLQSDFQLSILDSFGHLWKTRSAYAEPYRLMADLDARRRALEGDDAAVSEQIEWLRSQIREIEEAGLENTVEEDLEREHTTVANAQRILELIEGIRHALTEDESCAFGRLAQAQVALAELSGILPEAAEWQSETKAAAIQIKELSSSMAGRALNIEADPARLQWLESRKALIHKLKRKHGATVPDVLKSLERARLRLSDLETRGAQLAELDAQRAAAQQRLEAEGAKLSQARKKAGKALGEAITRELRGLGFPHGAFEVGLQPAPAGPSGLDAIEFGFAPNIGEPMRPLRLIASSGEISRVMLATKAILARHDRIPVLVFDEIDANVGGEMGSAIGEKLAAVAAAHQVLCVTHLPQVAAFGTTHLVVSKEVCDGRTCTGIRPVQHEERVEEVARMLGGRDLTSVTLKHAREMLKR